MQTNMQTNMQNVIIAILLTGSKTQRLLIIYLEVNVMV